MEHLCFNNGCVEGINRNVRTRLTYKNIYIFLIISIRFNMFKSYDFAYKSHKVFLLVF